MQFSLFETGGELSSQAIDELTATLEAFYDEQLTAYYQLDGDYYSSVSFAFVEQRTASQVFDEPLRGRHLQTGGTDVVYDIKVQFREKAPSSGEMVDTILFISDDDVSNIELVEDVAGTGNDELSNVFVVQVAEVTLQVPTPSPTDTDKNYLKNPDGIDGPPGNQDKPNTVIIISAVAGVATLTMMLFVFVGGRRRRRRNSEARDPRSSSRQITSLVSDTPYDDDLGENGNNEGSIMSSVTDWNDYGAGATIQSVHREWPKTKDADYDAELAQRQAAEVAQEETQKSHACFSGWCGALEVTTSGEDQYHQVETEGEGLRSAAALNVKGTMTLEKEDDNVVPKTWELMQKQAEEDSHREETSATGYGLGATSDDTSTEIYSGGNQLQHNDGSFPTAKHGSIPLNERHQSGSTNISRYDWSAQETGSHIGTVEEDSSGKEKCISDEEKKLDSFIEDLAWLNDKIIKEKVSKENAKGESSAREELDVQHLDQADSYSYDLNSPQSWSSEEYSDKQSTLASQARSITCRDVYLPPGDQANYIQIVSTKDGPMIRSVVVNDNDLQEHVKPGDLVMALDDRDTRSMTGKSRTATTNVQVTWPTSLTLLISIAPSRAAKTNIICKVSEKKETNCFAVRGRNVMPIKSKHINILLNKLT